MTINLILALLSGHLVSEGYLRLKSVWLRGGVYGVLCALVLVCFSNQGFASQGVTSYGVMLALAVAIGLGVLRTVLGYLCSSERISVHEPSLKVQVSLQVLMVLLLIGSASYLTQVSTTRLISFISNLFNIKHSVILFGYALILKPSSLLIEKILKRYSLSDILREHNGLKAGGELIGYLERILILTFSLQGEYAVIGFILTAKSIFRFGELNHSQNRSLTEYVLLGSLLSVTITSIIALMVNYFQ